MVLHKRNAAFTNIYLILYNWIQFLGWTYGFLRFTVYVWNTSTYENVWQHIGPSLLFFQTLQFLDVIHALFGLVAAPVPTTALQVFARNLVVWFILGKIPETHSSIGLPMLFVTWSLAEMSRYLFYALKLLNLSPYLVTWARYSLFLVNYPVGSSGEILVIISALPYIRQRKLFTIELPNPLNISFYFDYFMILSMFSSVYVLPTLFTHMLRQRSKVLK